MHKYVLAGGGIFKWDRR